MAILWPTKYLRQYLAGRRFITSDRDQLNRTSPTNIHEEQPEQYVIDDRDLIWFTGKTAKKPTLAIPRSVVADVLSLVHTLHGHPGVASTLILIRERFHWHTMARDVREYVLSCGCRRRKRSRSQQVALLPARAVEHWEVIEIDLLRIGGTSLSGNDYMLLAVDKASKFPFAFPLSSKKAEGVARHLLQLCLTFGVPRVIRSDGGREFEYDVVKHLCRWLKADIQFGPAEHPRGQGAIERLGGWIQDILSELGVAWPDRWDDYVSPACWVKRTLPDPSLPKNLSPFEMLFGRKPRTSLDSLLPRIDTDMEEGLDNFVETRRQYLREVRLVLEKRHSDRARARQRVNDTIARQSPGSTAAPGDLVLVRESDSNIQRNGLGGKLEHERWTGPWKYAWPADYGLASPSVAATPLYTLSDRRVIVTESGSKKWEYRGRYQNGRETGWLTEIEILGSFTRLQLDVFHALWNLYHPHAGHQDRTPRKKRPNLSREEALQLFPVGTRISKPHYSYSP